MPVLPDWVTASFPVFRIIMIILLVLLCIATVVAIFLQPSEGHGGAGVITGQSSDTYYSKHKKQSLQGLMKKLTVIFGISAAVIAILFMITIAIYPVPM